MRTPVVEPRFTTGREVVMLTLIHLYMSKKYNKTILVVEDEIPLLEVIKKKLQLNDYSVVTARSVDQALEYLKEIDDVGIIWLDHYLLGEKNGLDFVAELKNTRSKWKHVPIVVVSNSAGPFEIRKYYELGVVHYYLKAETRLGRIVRDINILLDKKRSKISA